MPIAQVGDKGEYYYTDADDDTKDPVREKTVTAAIGDICDELKDKVDETSRIVTMDHWQRHAKATMAAHGSRT